MQGKSTKNRFDPVFIWFHGSNSRIVALDWRESGCYCDFQGEAIMLELKTDKAADVEYEQDLALWYARQADLLRERRFDQLDLENLIEELEVAKKNLERELNSRLRVLLMHLLKCQFQHGRISGSWRGTLSEQRAEIRDLIEENPSFRPGLIHVAAKVYPMAVHRAAEETGLPESTFPAANPYSSEQLLDRHFVP
jgi:hypothetical protein